MSKVKLIAVFAVILFVVPGPASAQEEPREEGGDAAAVPAPPAVAPNPLPWFVMTGRLAFGGGSGSATFDWESFNGLASHEEENVPVKNLGHGAIYPEAFFMPTKARRFIISASLPMGGGSGTMGQSDKLKSGDDVIGARTEQGVLEPGDRIFDGEDVSYNFIFLNLGLRLPVVFRRRAADQPVRDVAHRRGQRAIHARLPRRYENLAPAARLGFRSFRRLVVPVSVGPRARRVARLLGDGLCGQGRRQRHRRHGRIRRYGHYPAQFPGGRVVFLRETGPLT
ncbi:MAG: hypothetical protein M5R36_26235 [Deltaproteobacteria bacterium]|nr:hypothetical protein [Deltaproteobacteria bacterium]